MAYQQYRVVDFGPSRGGLATVGYTLAGGSRITAGVAEIGVNTGSYEATITLADDFAGSILWDTGEGANTVYAVGAINPPPALAEDGLDAVLDAPSAVGGGSIREALEAMAAVLAGDLVQDATVDGQVATDTFKAFRNDAAVALTSESTRTSRNVEFP